MITERRQSHEGPSISTPSSEASCHIQSFISPIIGPPNSTELPTGHSLAEDGSFAVTQPPLPPICAFDVHMLDVQWKDFDAHLEGEGKMQMKVQGGGHSFL